MPQKILIVDDSKTIRAIVARILKNCDCVALEAADGAEGLAIAASEMPALILIDAAMPVMDGATLVARLREDAALKEIPVIMLVPESDRESIAKVGQLGVSDHIVKPFKDEHLIEKIGRIIPFAGKVTA